MVHALTFDLRKSWFLLLGVAVAVLAARVRVPLAELAAIVLVWLLVYRLNVEEKVKKTWEFFHALPLTLWQRAVVKIAVPFLLVLAAFALAEDDLSIRYLLGGGLGNHILAASVLVLASVVAAGMGGYIGIFWLVFLPALLLGALFHTDLVVAGASLGVAFAYLSGKRVAPLKAGGIAVCVVLPLAIGLSLARIPTYRALMRLGSPQMRLEAAVYLLSKENDRPARVVLSDRLRQQPDAELAERIFEAFEDSSLSPDLSQSDFESLLREDAGVRASTLTYLAGDGQSYDWLDPKVALGWEALVVGQTRAPPGEPERSGDATPKAELGFIIEHGAAACSDDCQALAMLVTELFLDELDWQHFAAHLRSGDPVRIEYALTVVEASETPVLTETLIELVASGMHGEAATDILLDWAEERAETETDTLLDEIDDELAPVRAKKLQSYFKERLVEPRTGRTR